ncbi:MAG: endonuclease VIII [Gammaproteobacteria bacterium]|nr:endonuclease VIII [Gammaproteobacteria bacterium]
MPEGPEIRLAADRVARVLVGKPLREVFLAPPRLRRFRPRLTGASVSRVETRGKAMLTHFDNGLTLYSHNQLYGRWYVRPRGALPRTRRSLRVGLHTDTQSALLYSASDIDVLTADQLESHPFLRRLGPDVLSEDLTWQALAARLNDSRFRGRSLASLYLDQGFVAGIGNYLRSEILFFARVSHCRKPRDLGRSERQRLARQTLAVARRSYQTRGVTNLPSRLRTRRAGDAGRDDRRFAVFARAGKGCDVCGSVIERTDAGSRRLYYCPDCQT